MDLEQLSEYILPLILLLLYLFSGGKKKQKSRERVSHPQRQPPVTVPPAPLIRNRPKESFPEEVSVRPASLSPIETDQKERSDRYIPEMTQESSIKMLQKLPDNLNSRALPQPNSPLNHFRHPQQSSMSLRSAFIAHEIFERYEWRRQGIYTQKNSK